MQTNLIELDIKSNYFSLEHQNPFGVLIQAKKPNTPISVVPQSLLLSLFHQHQLIVLRDFQNLANKNEFISFSSTFGKISEWPFGKILDLKEQSNPEDHIFDNNYVPLHWDGMYRLQVPEFQIFHCVEAPLPEEGGRTTFSHTRLALETASSSNRELWKKVTGHYQRKMEFYDSKTVAPIVSLHPYKHFEIIRYNEPPKQELRPFLNPPILKFEGIAPEFLNDFHHSLQAALHAPNCYYAHQWQSGDIVIADNYTLLHGRESFKTKSPRYLRRIHVLGNPAVNNPHLVSYK